MTRQTTMTMNGWQKAGQAFWLLWMAVWLTACGGAIEAAKQQVTVSTQSGEVAMLPGDKRSFTANATAHDEALQDMKWTLEALELPNPQAARPELINGACTNKTLTLEGNDGKGRCTMTVSIPDQAQPSLWKVLVQADAVSKGSASAYFTLRIGNSTRVFWVESASPVAAKTNQRVTLSAAARTRSGDVATDIRYSWTQHDSSFVLAGAQSADLSFVPTAVGEYRFTVTATATVQGKVERATAEVVVEVEDSTLPTGLLVSAVAEPAMPETVGVPVSLAALATFNGSELPANATYAWKAISHPGSTAPVLTNASTSLASFIPRQTGTYVFEVKVKAVISGRLYEGTAVVEVLVGFVPDDGNFDVKAQLQTSGLILTDSVVEVRAEVTPTTGVENLTHAWSVVSAPAAVTLVGSNEPTAYFVPKAGGEYVLRVTVTGKYNGVSVSDSADVLVIVNERTPGSDSLIVTVNDAQVIELDVPPAPVILTVSGVTFPNGQVPANPAYAWRQVDGPTPLAIANANTATASVIPDMAGTYLFEVTVTVVTSDSKTYTGRSQTIVRVE